MKVPDCPRCETELEVVTFGDGTYAGHCRDCGAYLPLVLGMNRFHIQRRYWLEKQEEKNE